MAEQLERPPPIKSVDRAFKIIELIRRENGKTASQLADELELPMSTVSDYLVTLNQQQYLVKEGAEYRVGLRFLELGDHARSNHPVYRVGQDKVDNLADTTGELAHLSVEQGGLGVIIYERSGPQAVSLDTYVGRRVELHCTALGKAMLASLSADTVDDIIDRRGLDQKTDRTITDRAELDAELDRIRERGYAISRGERIDGLGCLAVPILGNNGADELGALSLCAPQSRMEPEGFSEEVVSLVRDSADRIELDYAFN